MKTFKLTKGIQIILVTLLVIAVGLIIVGVFANNKVMAATCGTCGDSTAVLANNETQHYYFCYRCNINFGHENHTYSNYTCTVCGYTQSHTHSYATSGYVSNGNGSHTRQLKCTCGATTTAEQSACEGGTHANGGVCTTCDGQYQSHVSSGTVATGRDAGNGSHQVYYACAFSGCDGTIEGGYEAHKYSGSTCTVCGYVYDHEHTFNQTFENKGETHTITYTCECGYSYNEENVAHSDGEDGNGKCACGKILTFKCSGCGGNLELDSEATTSEHHLYKCVGTDETLPCGLYQYETHSGSPCTVCGYDHEHTFNQILENKGETHTITYTCECGYSYNEENVAHSDGEDGNGKCACGKILTFKCSGCGGNLELDSEATTSEHHLYKCVGTDETLPCGLYQYETYSGSPCTVCGLYIGDTGNEETENPDTDCKHEGGTHPEGKCTKCGVVYQSHHSSGTIAMGQCRDRGEGSHQEYYTCVVSGCTGIIEGGVRAHEITYTNNGDGTCSGVCEPCLYEVEAAQHNMESGKCTRCGYTTSSGPSGEECSHTYEIKHDETNHWEECSKCGDKKTAEAHKGATHDNGGKCTVCEYVYQEHKQSETVKEYTDKNEKTHTPVYACAVEGCETTYNGTAGEHEGGTHDNGGKCTVCEHVYQEHKPAETVKEYIDKNEKTHTPVYECTYEGCESTHKGTAEEHEGGTHDNGGKCTVCEHIYQEHKPTETVKEYTDKNEKTHTPVYVCSYTGCESTHKGTAEEHQGGTHKNGGKCTVCEYVYQEHKQSETPSSYTELNDETHTPVYKCTFEGCEITYNGTAEKHTIEKWSDNENATHTGKCEICGHEVTKEHNYNEDGECEDCGAEEPEEECEHNYEINNNETQHWHECTICNEEQDGSRENHIYGKYEDNGDGTHTATCIVCKYELTEKHNYDEDGECDCGDEEPEKECEHTYEMENDEKQHWKECTICDEEQDGSRENHTYDNYIDNKDGTHSARCTKCGYEKTEKHNYDDNGDCGDCDYVEPDDDNNDDNNDNNENNNNGDNNDNNNDNKDDNAGNNNNNSSNNANKDNSTVNNEIPKAGAQSTIFIVIAVLGVISLVSISKMKKYKNI